jgi:3-oxoacyl-[acyl-carrier-protein] synthase II
VRLAFGAAADRVYVSTCKGQLGHTLGASGAIEAAITILAMSEGRLPPTMGLMAPGADTALNHIIGQALLVQCRHALSSSFGFGGLGAVLAFSHVDTPSQIPSMREQRLVITSLSDALPVTDPLSTLDPERSRRFDRVTALTCAGAQPAVAGDTACGLVVGNAYGNVERLRGYLGRLAAKGIRGIAPAEFPHLVPSAIAGNASIYLNLTGPVTLLTDQALGCESAVDFACSLIELGLAQSMVAGVAESRDAGAAMIADPFRSEASSTPMPGDASTWIRVETDESAHQRGLTALARIVQLWTGSGPWYRYFVEHEVPASLERLVLLFGGAQAESFARLTQVGRWTEAARRDFDRAGQAAVGRSATALAGAILLIIRNEADEVVLVSKAATRCFVVRLRRP